MKKMFTLFEVAVIAGLTAVGIFSIAAVTEKASKKDAVAVCADNMKKISAAAYQYAADNNNMLPGTANRLNVNWQMLIAPYLGYKNLKAGWRPNEYPIYLCPADKSKPAAWLRVNNHIAKISYCGNASLIDDFYGDVNTDGHRGGRKLDTVGKKDQTILFAEFHNASNALRYGASIKCYQPGYTYEYTVQRGTLENDDGKVGYHDYKNNWAMADGSVIMKNFEETLKPVNLWIYKKP